MSLTKNYQQLALYNRWMNKKIYDATLTLSDEELKKDRSAFFKSIHSTMNHIFWADIGWISRFQDTPYPVERGAMGEDIIEDYKTLSIEHLRMADHIIDWTQSLKEEALVGDYSWTPAWGGDPITKPLYLLVTHLFNHQTHHRGQITQMLHPHGNRYRRHRFTTNAMTSDTKTARKHWPFKIFRMCQRTLVSRDLQCGQSFWPQLWNLHRQGHRH